MKGEELLKAAEELLAGSGPLGADDWLLDPNIVLRELVAELQFFLDITKTVKRESLEKYGIKYCECSKSEKEE